MGRRSLLCAAASTAGPVRSTWRMLGQTIKVSPTSILSSPECDWPGAYRSASTSMKRRQASLLQRGSPPLLRSNIAPGLNRSLLTIYVSTQFAHCFGSFNSASDANYRYWRILPVAPAATFSPFPPVRTAHREHVLRVELTHSPRSLERPLLAQSKCSTHPRVGSRTGLSATKRIPIVPEGRKLFENHRSDRTNRRAFRGTSFFDGRQLRPAHDLTEAGISVYARTGAPAMVRLRRH